MQRPHVEFLFICSYFYAVIINTSFMVSKGKSTRILVVFGELAIVRAKNYLGKYDVTAK